MTPRRMLLSIGALCVVTTSMLFMWTDPGHASSPSAFPSPGFLFASGNHLLFVDNGTLQVEELAVEPTSGIFVGIAVRTDGDVLLSAVATDRILRMDSATREVTVVTQGNLITNPDGILLVDDDLLYVADLETGSLIEVDVNTSEQRAVISDPSLFGIAWIARGASGEIFATVYTQSRIIRINPVTGTYSDLTVPGAVQSPHGIVMGPDGNLYVSSFETASIKRVNPNNGAVTNVTTGGLLNNPLGISVGPDGFLYVMNYSVGPIVRVDPVTGGQAQYAAAQGLHGIAPYPALPINGPPPPPAPTNVAASDLSDVGVDITWDDAIGEDGYIVTRDGVDIAMLPPGTTSYVDVTTPGTYNYCVRAFIAQSLSMPACDLGTRLPPAAPPAPDNVVATDNSAFNITVTWSDVEGEEGYEVTRDGDVVATVAADVSSFVDQPAAGTYAYCVRSFVETSFSIAVCDSGTRLPPREEPIIDFVRDVANDQGGRVQIGWQRSELDVVPGPNPIVAYRIWRRLPPLPEAGHSREPVESAALVGELRQLQDAAGVITYWEALVTLPAAGLEGYGYIAATPFDSLPSQNTYTAFFVSALTANHSVFYDSEVDSGYSVDNLDPAMPSGVAGTLLEGGGVHIQWNPPVDADFREFAVYRGTSEDFIPAPKFLLGKTQERDFTDPTAGVFFYRISAFDIHGNESGHALLSPIAPVGVPDTVAPLTSRFVAPAPNPSVGSVSIAFAIGRDLMPAGSGPLRVRIHDTAGRLVRLLRSGTSNWGPQTVEWDGRDDNGRSAHSGIYQLVIEVGAARRSWTIVRL